MKNRDLKFCVYTLKRLHGQLATVNKRTVGSVDYDTGKQTITDKATSIRRVVLLPVNFYTLREYALLANKFGASIQVGDRQVVIDYVDYPSGVDVDDYLTINSKKYRIIEILDLDAAYQLLLRNTQGEVS